MEHASATGLVDSSCIKATEEELQQVIADFLASKTTLQAAAKQLGYTKKCSLIHVLRGRVSDLATFNRLVLKEGKSAKQGPLSTRKSVYGVHKDTAEKTQIFDMLTSAAKYVGATASMIKKSADRNAVQPQTITSKNYYWYYL